jgi:glycogen debranching enzyme
VRDPFHLRPPLFLLLAGDYFAWSGDVAFAGICCHRCEQAWSGSWGYGDLDGDGFVEYRTESTDGLKNQGWKDSTEAVMHADGALCQGPIALAEVQGYVYSAYESLSHMFAALGEDAEAEALNDRAAVFEAAIRGAVLA